MAPRLPRAVKNSEGGSVPGSGRLPEHETEEDFNERSHPPRPEPGPNGENPADPWDVRAPKKALPKMTTGQQQNVKHSDIKPVAPGRGLHTVLLGG